MSSFANQSYFVRNASRVDNSPLHATPPDFKRLITSFLTIKQFYNLFYSPKLHIKNHLSDDFINEIIIPDFNWIILCLMEYRGNLRTGVSDAYGFMNQALREMYYTDGTIKNFVAAVMDSREYLRLTYEQLEHLDEYGKYLK